jgi:hypothetical protein
MGQAAGFAAAMAGDGAVGDVDRGSLQGRLQAAGATLGCDG